jgi:predicted dehydrogenase
MAILNIGIVGTGMMLDYHFDAFNKLPNVKILGCTRQYYGSPGEQKSQQKYLSKKAQKLGIKAYPHFKEMVQVEDIHALVIASINPFHFDQIMEALKYGKHVLAEKPVVTDVNHIDMLASQRIEYGKVLFPGHNFVYRPVVRKAKEIIQSAELGMIIYASFISCFRSGKVHSHGWRASAKLSSGGALMDSGHHQIYQSLFLLGKPIRLQAFTSKQIMTHMEVEDFAMINAIYDDGFITNIGQGHSSDYGDVISGIKIIGEKGNLVITDACYHNGEKIIEDADYKNSFCHQAKYFVDCVENGSPPLSGLEDVKDTLQIIFGAYTSASENKVVVI